jgi:hypothetical protein
LASVHEDETIDLGFGDQGGDHQQVSLKLTGVRPSFLADGILGLSSERLAAQPQTMRQPFLLTRVSILRMKWTRRRQEAARILLIAPSRSSFSPAAMSFTSRGSRRANKRGSSLQNVLNTEEFMSSARRLARIVTVDAGGKPPQSS